MRRAMALLLACLALLVPQAVLAVGGAPVSFINSTASPAAVAPAVMTSTPVSVATAPTGQPMAANTASIVPAVAPTASAATVPSVAPLAAQMANSTQDALAPPVQAQSGPLLRTAIKSAETGSLLGALVTSKLNKEQSPATAPGTVVVLPPQNTATAAQPVVPTTISTGSGGLGVDTSTPVTVNAPVSVDTPVKQTNIQKAGPLADLHSKPDPLGLIGLILGIIGIVLPALPPLPPLPPIG